MPDQAPSSSDVKAALYAAIIKSAAELHENASAAAEAEGLKNLAEAFAWVTYPNQQHS
ncbi:hypothetical protein RM863_12705 [Streptomyces sp. DSM 41014]|uniref:Uncharacterized protein n=1 Tax=Streptomyces hintoniae TaxID=3075521 RepID=A0ABU2UI95_9ACTN|nr:hypothetical protein [Streptomyces sp. DSM 41014]MDT0472984.1 hypothetical protein [Streptomyces sp. DSM 41014]